MMQTVRKQLEEALEGHGCQVARADHPPCIDERPARTLWCDTCLAIDRARAEPEGCICNPACDQPSEAHCADCGCYLAGYQAGKQAGPFADREAGIHSQTPEAEEAPESVRVFYAGNVDGCILGAVGFGKAIGDSVPFRISPARKPHREGAPRWDCQCGAFGIAGDWNLVAMWREVRRHFWYNHADRRVKV